MNIFYLLAFIAIIYFLIKWKDNLQQKQKDLTAEKEIRKQRENFISSDTTLLGLDSYIENKSKPHKKAFIYHNEIAGNQLNYAFINIPFQNRPPQEVKNLAPYSLHETHPSTTAF